MNVRRILSWLRSLRSSLLARIGIALLLLGVVPLAVVSYRIVRGTAAALHEQLQTTQSIAARSTAERIDGYLEARRSLARSLATHPLLLEDPNSPAVQRLMRSMLEAWTEQGVVALSLTNAAGGLVLRAQAKDLPPAVREIAGHAAGAPGGIALETVAGAPWCAVAVDIPEGLGQVAVLSDASRLLGPVLRTEELNREADLLLAEPPDRVLLGRPAALAGLPGLRKAALSGRLSGSGRFNPAVGPEVLASWYPVAGGRFAVISLQPASVAERQSREMRRRAWGAVALAVGLAGLLSAAAYRSLIRPIRELVAAQRQLSGLPAVAEAGNEIEQLKSSFARLAQRVRDREALGKVFLGRYEVVEMISGGGMGTVFRGWDPKLKRHLALKTIRLDRELPENETKGMTASLIEEALTFARFSHPNIVAIYDAEDLPEAAFIAMELVDGPTLENHLFDSGRLRPELVVPLGIALARALDAAHERGLVHHDVKPGNVLLGQDGSIKVTDFGIARLLSQLAESAAGKIFGTPGYLPPETFLGQGYDERGDLFALGAILYYGLAGHHPFEGGNAQDMARKTVGSRPAPLHLAAGWETLGRSVSALLEKDWSRRTATAGQVLAELEPLAAARGLAWKLEKPAPRSRIQEIQNELSRSRLLSVLRLRSAAGGRPGSPAG